MFSGDPGEHVAQGQLLWRREGTEEVELCIESGLVDLVGSAFSGLCGPGIHLPGIIGCGLTFDQAQAFEPIEATG